MATLQQQAAAVSTDLRHLSHDLHPGVLQHLGLLEALRSRCDEFHTETNVDTHLEVCDAWRDVPDDIALCLYRVAHEALRNVAQHANPHQVHGRAQPARRSRVHAHQSRRPGFDPHVTSHRSGLRLLSLGERGRMLGGTMEVGGLPTAGATLAVTLPLGGTDATDGAPG